MLKNYINILHTNLALELETYRNLPFYLAIPYMISKPGSYMWGLGDNIYTYVIKKDISYFSVVNPHNLVDYGPLRFIENYYNRYGKSNFNVYATQFSIGKEKRNDSYFKKYVYSRNDRLRNVVGSLTNAYNKTEGGVPNYLVYLYLNFYRDNQVLAHNKACNKDSLIKFDKQNKLLKFKEELSIGKKYQVLSNDSVIDMYEQKSSWWSHKFTLPSEELLENVNYDPYPYIRYKEEDDGSVTTCTVSGGTTYVMPDGTVIS